jgi:AbiU2
MFEDMTAAERIQAAKEKTARVLDHLLYLLELHANNAHVVYSPLLSSQIPRSFAANAFDVLQRSMHQFEIVRLCALWDSADINKQNIPTVIELIDDNSIIDTLANETRSHFANEPAFAEEEAKKARTDLRLAIADARSFLASAQLDSIMNIRDKHLAHSLERTRREKAFRLRTRVGTMNRTHRRFGMAANSIRTWISSAGLALGIHPTIKPLDNRRRPFKRCGFVAVLHRRDRPIPTCPATSRVCERRHSKM